MNFRTKQYLRKRFGDYYQNSELTLPPDFTRREWGFIFFDELPEVVMRRHKAFSSEGEALEYLHGMVPAHVYHSAAYYQFPGAGTMKEKQWQGADLIFDLDADHLPVKARSYAEMLSNVKKEASKLIKDFLLDDFGFSEDNISIVFSGGRGYHIHVRDPKILHLESAERREIVDYIGGEVGPKEEFIFEENMGKKLIASFKESSDGFGWGKRLSKHLVFYLKDLSTKEVHIALGDVSHALFLFGKLETQDNFTKEVASQIFKLKMEHPNWNSRRIAQQINENAISEQLVHDILLYGKKARKVLNIANSENSFIMINKGIVDFGGIPEFGNFILKATRTEFGIKFGAKKDEPVTADVKRLIRMPSSLHGGSGMRVVPLKLSEFEKFEPLNDAVVFSEKEIKIEIITPLKPQNSMVEMKGKSFRVEEGINTLPEYAAMYLMCRGAAEYA